VGSELVGFFSVGIGLGLCVGLGVGKLVDTEVVVT